MRPRRSARASQTFKATKATGRSRGDSVASPFPVRGRAHPHRPARRAPALLGPGWPGAPASRRGADTGTGRRRNPRHRRLLGQFACVVWKRTSSPLRPIVAARFPLVVRQIPIRSYNHVALASHLHFLLSILFCNTNAGITSLWIA